MTLAEYRARVARAIGMSSSDAEETALIDAWVNEAVVQFLRETKVNVLTASLNTTADVGDYTLDEDILAFSNVWYSPASGQESLLEPLSARDLIGLRRLEDGVSSAPRYYATTGAHLFLLYPTPTSSSDMVHILYVPRPGQIADVSHSPSDEARGSVPPEYHPTIEAYVKWKAAEAHEHRPSEYGLKFQAEYERGIAKVRGDMNRKSGVFRARKHVGRQGLYPMTPGTDLR